jgi:hypothetical protein
MGVTSPPGDEVQLAQSILKILGRPGDFFLSREEIETSYSTSAVADQYEEMYRHLLEELP